MALPAAKAKLCPLCQSIPFHNLPPFPDSSYTRTLTGKQFLHDLIHRDADDPIPEPLGLRHHPDLASLRAASASGCELCREIERFADGVLEDIAGIKERYANNPIVLRQTANPSFELWLTQRGEGGDGFWVSTKNASAPDGLLSVIATFGYCAESASPLASTFLGRPIIGPPDGSVLDRISDWVKACDAHERCAGHHETALPTRLIDIGAPDSDLTVRLAEPDEGSMGRYTALSYCWGATVNPYVTSRSVLASRKLGIDIAHLPQTFQDAIAVTRRLGVRYIWIDSLCICQDDMHDWERESARMAAVYSNAYLTIAATGSSDSTGGLFFDRPGRRYYRADFTPTGSGDTTDGTSDTVGGSMLIFPLPTAKEVVRSYRVDMKDEPLSTRGWAFQERVLSRRVLHFASDQVCLECLEGTVYEDGLRVPRRYFCTQSATVLGRENDQGKKTALNKWNALLWQYNTRNLTDPSDKFPALSGIAKVYADLLDDEYVAGIWKKSMLEGLCWQGLRCKAFEGAYRAPSWSWASVDGTAATGFHRAHRDVATILDYHVEVDGDNPFGRIKDAWIKMEASLVPLYLSMKTGPTGHMCLETRSGQGEGHVCSFDTIDGKYSVSADIVREMDLFALVLVGFVGEGPKEETNPTTDSEILFYQCLVVTPATDDGSRTRLMKRVGWTFLEQENLEPGQLESTRGTLTLV